MFDAIARLAQRRPRRVVVAAVLIAVAAGAFGGGVAKHLYPYGADDPSTGSVKAKNLLEHATGTDPSVGLVALVDTASPPGSPRARTDIARVSRALRRDRSVAEVDTFYRTHDRAMVSRDGRSQYLTVRFKAISDKAQQDAADRLEKTAGRLPGVRLGGFAAAAGEVNHIVEHDLRRAELLAFPLLFLLSFVFFRSLVAAALPLFVGGMAIVGTFLILRVASELTQVSVFALNLTTGLGLGLAIDYSLFMVSRYREEIANTGPGLEALRRTVATAGRIVLFSSLTVAAALASLLVFPQRFLYSMGLGGSLVTLVAATVAIVVLPAVLALLGNRVNAGAPRRLQRAAERDARPAQAGAWYRLSRFVMRRPGPIAVASATLLIVLGLPFTGIKFNTVDATVLPKDAEARQVDTALKTRFPPHHSSPIYVAVDSPATGAVRDYTRRLARLPGAAAVQGPRKVSRDVSLVQVVSRYDVLDDGSDRLI